MLYLVPSPLSQDEPLPCLLEHERQLILDCAVWIVETPKACRKALKSLGLNTPLQELEVHELARTSQEQLVELLTKASKGLKIGLMSDAGCPAIADPGSGPVALAHQVGCVVRPLVGPNSIVLGLMASGLNGQSFCFHGYPPVQDAERASWIKQTETDSRRGRSTQIVIETPFRNQKLLQALKENLGPATRLCVAMDLSSSNPKIESMSISDWRRKSGDLPKVPALFLWLA